DLPQTLKETEADGIRLIDKEPRPGAHGADIAFLHPKSTGGVLIEFCKEKH
ncbi:MAG: methylmalonyl-CoA epimerase, partial [Candidatus Cloacimonetes bacterium]|nr:methylmalonyl-CoA epimerase [Candidatus Cloacimonadota bacterium]